MVPLSFSCILDQKEGRGDGSDFPKKKSSCKEQGKNIRKIEEWATFRRDRRSLQNTRVKLRTKVCLQKLVDSLNDFNDFTLLYQNMHFYWG